MLNTSLRNKLAGSIILLFFAILIGTLLVHFKPDKKQSIEKAPPITTATLKEEKTKKIIQPIEKKTDILFSEEKEALVPVKNLLKKQSETKPQPQEKRAINDKNKLIGKYIVQVASFSYYQNAVNLNKKLNKAGLHSQIKKITKKRTIYQVRLGPYASKDIAQKKLKLILRKYHLTGMILNK